MLLSLSLPKAAVSAGRLPTWDGCGVPILNCGGQLSEDSRTLTTLLEVPIQLQP